MRYYDPRDVKITFNGVELKGYYPEDAHPMTDQYPVRIGWHGVMDSGGESYAYTTYMLNDSRQREHYANVRDRSTIEQRDEVIAALKVQVARSDARHRRRLNRKRKLRLRALRGRRGF